MTDELTAENPRTLPGFFDALADGVFLVGECDCGQTLIPPRPRCYACGSDDVAVAERSGTGEVVSYTEVRTPPPAFEAEAPYTIAIVELSEGGRLTGRVDAAYDDVAIGAPVALTVREPTPAVREAALSYEADWPLHVFELG